MSFRTYLQAISPARLQTLSIVTFAHGFVAVAFFAQMGLLARLLPLAEFGDLATAIAIATVAEAAINSRGAETALAAFAAKADASADERQGLTAQLFRIDLAWNVAAYALFALAILAADAMRGTDSHLLLILMIGGLLSFPWGTAKGYITVYLGPRAFSPIEIAYAATSLFLGVGLAALLGSVGFAIGLVAASAIRSVMGMKALRLPLLALLAKRSGPGAVGRKTIAWFGATGTLRAALVNLVLQADLLLLAAISSPASVGLYRAAKTLSSLTQRVSQPVWVVLKRPIIAGAMADGADHSRKWVALAALGFAITGLVVLPPILVYANELMALAFGAAFRPAGALLWWLLPGAWTMYAVTGWSGLFGSISRKRITVLAVYIVQLLAFVAASFAFGTTMLGVAKALALSQVLAATAFWILFLRVPLPSRSDRPEQPG